MGSASSRLRKSLIAGDEVVALQLYQGNSDLRKALDPNQSYGENYQHNTPLHYAAKHAMKGLLKVFLNELNGNPNKKNNFNETSIHHVCQMSNGTNTQSRRYDCLVMMINWVGAKLADGQQEKADLSAEDEKGCLPLHYAAQSGLDRCVKLLVTSGSPLYIENQVNLTPCDVAEREAHSHIALYLESKMVFSGDDATPVIAGTNEESQDRHIIDTKECFTGLRAQDLQEAKDHLLVETSDMLRVPLFTAEALLRNFEWCREMLLDAWIKDSLSCCEKAGVTVPPSVLNNQAASSFDDVHDLVQPEIRSLRNVPVEMGEESFSDSGLICDICMCDIPPSSAPVPMTCEHQFCRECWEGYLNVKIKEGDAYSITCPGYDCNKLVPVELIETIVSRDMARRYLLFDIKAFVDSNPHIKWCPFPGCGRAVKLPDVEAASPGQRNSAPIPADTSRSVDCGSGHYFCWDCGEVGHAPCSCENWKKWIEKIIEVDPEKLNQIEGECETAANVLWLVTNSKRCPNGNCMSPIQKNEGCNHMKCSKCKYDFCWVCLEPWKKHSSATGGYFRCNRYDVSEKVDKKLEELRDDAKGKHKTVKELNKFYHYYTRYKNHENSYKLEEPLLDTAKEKMLTLAKAINDPDTAESETQFVKDAVHELLKARNILKFSYVYGYYMDEVGYKKKIFESMQTELEESTESLSQMVARPYLRTPRVKIIETAQRTGRKRHDLLSAIMKGLIPIDYSPDNKRRYSLELDTETKKAILASLEDMDLKNPWIVDKYGRHTNVAALINSDDDEDDDTLDNQDLLSDSSPNSKCAYPHCGRRRGSQLLRRYCSNRCLRLDRLEKFRKRDGDRAETSSSDDVRSFQADIELLRGLEVSRIQLMQDIDSLKAPGPRERWSSDSESESSDNQDTLHHTGHPVHHTGHPVRHAGHPVSLALPPVPDVDEFDVFDLEAVEIDVQRAIELSQMNHPEIEDTSCSVAVVEDDSALKMAIAMSLSDSPQDTGASDEQQQVSDVVEASDVEATASPTSADIHIDSIISLVEEGKNIESIADEDDDTNQDSEERVDTHSAVELNASDTPSTENDNDQLTLYSDTDNTETADENVTIATSSDSLHPTVNIDEMSIPDLGTSFGLMKNLAVNNIAVVDLDKTKNFETKDFRGIYNPEKYLSSDEEKLLDSLVRSQIAASASSGSVCVAGTSSQSIVNSTSDSQPSVSIDSCSIGSARKVRSNSTSTVESTSYAAQSLSVMDDESVNDSRDDIPFLSSQKSQTLNSLQAASTRNTGSSIHCTWNILDPGISGKKGKYSKKSGLKYRHSSESDKDRMYRISHKNEIAAGICSQMEKKDSTGVDKTVCESGDDIHTSSTQSFASWQESGVASPSTSKHSSNEAVMMHLLNKTDQGSNADASC